MAELPTGTHPLTFDGGPPAATVKRMSWVAARLGGWNCYGKKPGPKTMADGWHRLSNMIAGFNLAKVTKDV